MVSINNNSLKTIAEGLSILNEKALKWMRKYLELGEIEKAIEDANCLKLVEKNVDSTPALEKDVEVESCLRKRSRTKKRIVVEFDELKEVVEMHEGVIEQNMVSMNVLEKML